MQCSAVQCVNMAYIEAQCFRTMEPVVGVKVVPRLGQPDNIRVVALVVRLCAHIATVLRGGKLVVRSGGVNVR